MSLTIKPPPPESYTGKTDYEISYSYSGCKCNDTSTVCVKKTFVPLNSTHEIVSIFCVLFLT